jgi:hypothetical protein
MDLEQALKDGAIDLKRYVEECNRGNKAKVEESAGDENAADSQGPADGGEPEVDEA